MRFIAALLLWLITTVALAAAVPAGWAQRNIVDADGYAALAQQAATDPTLQSAMAAELTDRASALINNGGNRVDSGWVRRVASGYTTGSEFPRQFAQANRIAHRWIFTDRVAQSGPDSWVVDVAPMLRDSAFQPLLNRYGVQVPDSVTVPLNVNLPDELRPGRLAALTTWGRWVSLGLAVLTGVGALLTLAAVCQRGKALVSLGVSALLVGAAGYAGIEIGNRYLNDALNHTTANVHEIADVMVGLARDGLHHWLLFTLAAGGAPAVAGIAVTMLGRLLRRQPG